MGSGRSSIRPLLLLLMWSKLFCSTSCGYTEERRKMSLDFEVRISRKLFPWVYKYRLMLSDDGRGVVKVKKRERSIVNILPQNKAKKKAESKGKDELKGTQYFVDSFSSQWTGVIPIWLTVRKAHDQMYLLWAILVLWGTDYWISSLYNQTFFAN